MAKYVDLSYKADWGQLKESSNTNTPTVEGSLQKGGLINPSVNSNMAGPDTTNYKSAGSLKSEGLDANYKSSGSLKSESLDAGNEEYELRETNANANWDKVLNDRKKAGTVNNATLKEGDYKNSYKITRTDKDGNTQMASHLYTNSFDTGSKFGVNWDESERDQDFKVKYNSKVEDFNNWVTDSFDPVVDSGWFGRDNLLIDTTDNTMAAVAGIVKDIMDVHNLITDFDSWDVAFDKSQYNTSLRKSLEADSIHTWAEIGSKFAGIFTGGNRPDKIIKKMSESIAASTGAQLRSKPFTVRAQGDAGHGEAEDPLYVDNLHGYGSELAKIGMSKDFLRRSPTWTAGTVPEGKNAAEWDKEHYANGFDVYDHSIWSTTVIASHSYPEYKKIAESGPKEKRGAGINNSTATIVDLAKDGTAGIKTRYSTGDYPMSIPKSSKVDKQAGIDALFDNNIDDLLARKFLQISSSEALSRIMNRDASLSTNAFLLLWKKDSDTTAQVLDFRITGFKVPEVSRTVQDMKFANQVLSVTPADYGTRKNMVEVEIIVDKNMKIFGKLLEAVGIGVMENGWINLSSTFNVDYKQLGDIYLQSIPGWFISKETNTELKLDDTDLISQWGSKAGEWKSDDKYKEVDKYPLYVFKNFQFKTVDTKFTFASKTDGSAHKIKAHVTFERLYTATAGGKEYFNDLLSKSKNPIGPQDIPTL